MITRIKSDRIISGKELISGYVYINDATITEVSQQELPFDKEVDLTGYYVSPGFIDMHTHGGAGHDFIDGEDAVVQGCNFHLKHGTTSILPTISAAPFAKMRHAVEGIHNAMQNPALQSNVIGAHLEGPYLSKAQCGAQCTDFITPPKAEEYESLVADYGNAIARWTYAPENDENDTFCKFLKENDIVASAGHTNAIYDDMLTAMENGCKLITHLYSCTSTITRKQGFRQLGVLETTMLHDEIDAEIIADGRHLPPELIRLIVKIKGIDRLALVTDSLAVAGTEAKSGFMLDTAFIIEDGVCKLADRSAFAGSIATTDVLVRTVIQEAGISLIDAVHMMTAVPARIMGLNKGILAPGKDADIVAFDDDINITAAFVMGKQVI